MCSRQGCKANVQTYMALLGCCTWPFQKPYCCDRIQADGQQVSYLQHMLHEQLAGCEVHVRVLCFTFQLVELPVGFLEAQPLSVPMQCTTACGSQAPQNSLYVGETGARGSQVDDGCACRGVQQQAVWDRGQTCVMRAFEKHCNSSNKQNHDGCGDILRCPQEQVMTTGATRVTEPTRN